MDHHAEDAMYRMLVQSVTDYAIYMLNTDGTVSNWNAGAERAKGYRSEEIIGRHFSVFYTEADRERGLPEHMLDTARRNGRAEGEGWRLRKDGTRFWAHVIVQPMRDSDGRILGFAKITRDMTEQREREAQSKEQERNFRILVQGVTDYAIYMLSPEGLVTNWNAGAERVKGYCAEDIVGQHFSRFYRPEDRRRELPERALATAREEGRFEGEGWRLRKDGSQFWAHVVIDAIRDEEGALIGFAKITRDITEKKKVENQVRHLAHHDSLTGLLNRAAFHEAMSANLKAHRRCALLYLDLDRFKPINDTLGHHVGDMVLQTVAERITRHLRKSDVCGRLGGDEFAVLLVDCESSKAASAACERLIDSVQEPIHTEGKTVSVGASAGIAEVSKASISTEALLRNADLALYAAKKEQRGTHRWYEAGMESVQLQRQAMESDLRRALKRQEFSLHYQPVVDTFRNNIIGYEALIRWTTPARGNVPPGEFIPLAEELGLMIDIGDWVLQAACRQAAAWPADHTIAVNLSPMQFRAPNLIRRIADILDETGLAPERLELEITETAMMEDITAARTILQELRAMGIRLAMDDFGTGYSSLSFLRMLPFTRIKIDKSFVQDLGKTQEALAIVRAVTGLCSSLGVETTAEGVETVEQRRILENEGCRQLQGYLLGRPAPWPQSVAQATSAEPAKLFLVA